MQPLTRICCLLAVVAVLFSSAVTVHASNIVYKGLDSSLDSGSLGGTTFSVCYSYDSDLVAPVGESWLPLNSFDFQLGDATFTRNDIFQGGQVMFRDGVLENVTASFQVRMPPNAPVTNITFGFGGPGVIGYSDLDYQYGEGSFLFNDTCGAGGSRLIRLPSRTPARKR